MIKQWLRRLRGVFGIGALWGIAGTAVGSIAAVAISVAAGLPFVETLLEVGLGVGGLGFVLGSTFAGLLTTLERPRTLEELTPRRAAGWGAAAGGGVALSVGVYFFASLGGAGASIPVGQLLLAFASGIGAYAALTAGLAATTVALAKRAPQELEPGVGEQSIPRLSAANDN